MIIKNESIGEICKLMSEIFVSFGFREITVSDRLNYECNGRFYRLTPLYKDRTILLEAAESHAMSQVNAYEDAGWYDLTGTPPISDEEKQKLLEKFRGDIVLYFSTDNFDEYLRSNSFKKTVRDGLVCYSRNKTEVKTYFDKDTAIWKIWIQKQNELHECIFSPIEPNKTEYEMKHFVKQFFENDLLSCGSAHERIHMKQKVAENIKRLRIEKNLTQSELATLLSVSPQAVSRWENGLAYPDIEIFPKLADYFGVTVDEMMGRTVPIIVQLSERITQLTHEYIRNAGNNASILPELCDLLEKATEIAPLRYSQSYFKFAKFLQEHTSSDHHINHARAVAHSVLGDTNSIYLTTLLRDIILREDEDKLEQWKKYITDSRSFSTWQDLLLFRYTGQRHPNWEKVYQMSLFDDVRRLIYNLTSDVPDFRPREQHDRVGNCFFPLPPSPEQCRSALDTLDIYSKDPYDIFFPTRLNVECQMAISLFSAERFEEGFALFLTILTHAKVFRKMLDEKTLRRSSIPSLSLVEIETTESTSCLYHILSAEKRSIFDSVREDERFISFFKEINLLFPDNDIQSIVPKHVKSGNKLMKSVLEYALKHCDSLTRDCLIEQMEQSGTCTNLGLRKLETICFTHLKKANIGDVTFSDIKVRIPPLKEPLTFTVVIKGGYLRSIESSEATEDLPTYINSFEILQ